MTETEIAKDQMLQIVRNIHSGDCIPFLGSAVNIGQNGNGLPLGPGLSQKLVEKLELEVDDPRNLSQVTLQATLRLGSLELLNALRELLPDLKTEPSQLLETLASLPFKIFITTNYDRLLELALEKKDKDFKIIIQISEGFEKIKVEKPFADLNNYPGTLVYKIHGTILNGSPIPPKLKRINDNSLEFLNSVLSEELKEKYCSDVIDRNKPSPTILTEEDYIQFLTAFSPFSEDSKNRIAIPGCVINKIQGQKVWLFLGYSLKDWDIRAIYRGFIEKIPANSGRQSYAIMKESSDIWDKLWGKNNVKIYNIDVLKFAEQLKKKYWETYKKCCTTTSMFSAF